METCQYCGAAVPAGWMGEHYGRCCPEVLHAFGPEPRRQRGTAGDYPLPDSYIRDVREARRRATVARRRRRKLAPL